MVKRSNEKAKARQPRKEPPRPAESPPTEDQVRVRAYQISQARGGAPGRELDDWLQAERELRGA